MNLKTVPIPKDFTYEDLQDAYDSVRPAPEIIFVGPDMLTAIKAKFTATQRFVSATTGFMGLRFNSAVIVPNKHSPVSGHNIELVYDDDFDEFTEWVKSEQEKAKAPKYNKEFRQFVDRRAKISRLGKNQQRGRLQRLGQRR